MHTSDDILEPTSVHVLAFLSGDSAGLCVHFPQEPTASSVSARYSSHFLVTLCLVSVTVTHMPAHYTSASWEGRLESPGKCNLLVYCLWPMCGTRLGVHTVCPCTHLYPWVDCAFLCPSSFTWTSGSPVCLPTQLDPSTHISVRASIPHPSPGGPVCADCLEAGGHIHTGAHTARHGPWGELSNTLSQNSAQGQEHNATSTKCSRKAETCQG